jgi:hypothetical protein
VRERERERNVVRWGRREKRGPALGVLGEEEEE